MHFERDVREICRDVYVKKINAMKRTYYELSMSEKTRLADYLYRTYHLGKAQIRRCLAMLY